VTAWFAISKFGVVGPYFFFEENGQTVTVKTQRYVSMLEIFFKPQLEEVMEETNMGTRRGYGTYCSSFNDEAATDVSYAPRLSEE